MATNSNISLNVQGKSTGTSSSSGLRSQGWFAKWPVIGIVFLLLGSLVFGTLAYNLQMTQNSFMKWDLAATRSLHADLKSIPSSLVEYVIFGFFLGKEMVIVIAMLLAAYFLYKQYWRELAMVVAGLGGGVLIWYALAQYFARPRPPGQMALLSFKDPSFPSGLALAAVLCYGLLGYLLVPRFQSRVLQWLTAFLLAVVIVSVGLSSLLWGSHYVSDVIAGYALGLAWAGLVYTLMERWVPAGTRQTQKSGSGPAVSQDLRASGLFRKWPVVGILLLLLGGLVFGGLSYNLLSHGPLLQVDTSVYRTLIARAKTASPGVNEIMIFGFFVGKQVVLIIVSLLCVYFIYKRFWRELAMILLSSAAGSFVWNFLIAYFARPRPAEQTGIKVTTIPSFPSGHTMSALIVYGFLAYLLIPKMPSLFWKWVVALAALAVILFIGFSRLFQGGHYLTDVIGGYALGLAWASLVYLIVENLYRRRKV